MMEKLMRIKVKYGMMDAQKQPDEIIWKDE